MASKESINSHGYNAKVICNEQNNYDLDKLPFELLGDQVRLQQVLINLTKNALKFTHKGLITIRTAYDYEQEMLQVSVIDTGKGIKLEEMAKLFTLFGKVDRTEDSNPDGLGMGLTICQKIIENSGGQIEMHSNGANKGSTFQFMMKMGVFREVNNQSLQTLEQQSKDPYS